jgi:membrane-associated phospholipid phosphatase
MLRTLGEPRFAPARRAGLYRLAAVLVAAGVVLFALVFVAVKAKTGLAVWDQSVHNWFVAARSPWATGFWEGLTTLASPTYLTIIGIVFALVWAWWRKELWRPGLLIAAMVATVAVCAVVKHVAARPRPATVDMVMGPDNSFSFPSGHTMGAAVFILVLGYLMLSRHNSAVRRVVLLLAVVVLIPAVAASRLYLGYHWLTDVTASVTLAIALLGVIIAVDVWLPLRRLSIVAPQPTGAHRAPVAEATPPSPGPGAPPARAPRAGAARPPLPGQDT